MIGIIIAMQQELLPYKSTILSTQKIYGKDFYLCRIGQKDVVIALSGIGKINASFVATIMVERFQVDLIVSTGVSGGLGVSKPLDIIVAEKVVQHDVDTTALGDPIGMVSTINKIFFDTSKIYSSILNDSIVGAKYGIIACGDQFIADAKRSKEIVDTFGAIACDMESGAIAQVAYIMNIDLVIIRGISDSADEEASIDFNEVVERVSHITYEAVKKAIEKI